MQRHRRDEIGLGQQLAPGPRHPAGEGRRAINAIGMLEAQDQLAARLVIAECRPGAGEGRRLRRASRAQRASSQIELEGKAAAGAERRLDEGEPCPAGRA
jgi:hypothetical protein